MVTLAVTGASGQLGEVVLRRLRLQAPAGIRVIAFSRDPERLRALPCDEARPADFADASSLARAFLGVDRLLLVSIEGDDDMRTQAHILAAQAAHRAGVKRIVYTSFFDVDPASPSVVARVHRNSEAAVRATGCDCVLLRNGPYLDNMALRVATAAREGGVFRMPAGQAQMPFIARADLADAAATALLGELTGQTAWRLSGAELLGFEELCDQVGKTIGLPVRYAPMSDAEYLQELASQGLPAALQARRLAYVQAMRAGFMTALTDDFQRLVGRPPQTLEESLSQIDLSAGQQLH